MGDTFPKSNVAEKTTSMLRAELNFLFSKSESCPLIHLANIVTTNYLPGTAQFTGNSKAKKTQTLSCKTSWSRGAVGLINI